MGQMSRMRQVSEEKTINQLLTEAMQVLAINPPAQQQPPSPPSTPKRVVWQGVVDWQEKSTIPVDENGKVHRQVPCQVSSRLTTAMGEPEVNAVNWPKTLTMQLIPKVLMHQFGSTFLNQSNNVIFHFSKKDESSEALNSLKEVMQTGFVGCVHFPRQENQNCDVRVLMLVSINELYTYVGFIPNDQPGFVTMMRNVATKNLKTIRRGKQGGMVGMQTGPDNQQLNPGMGAPSGSGTSRRGSFKPYWLPRSRGRLSSGSNVSSVTGESSSWGHAQIPTITVANTLSEMRENLMKMEQQRQSLLAAMEQQLQEQQPPPSTPKQVVWQGVIDWQEKSTIPVDENGKIHRQVPCQVSSRLTTSMGEPEVNAVHWPKTLKMQLLPKALMHQFGSTFLRQSNNVIFHFSKNDESSEALNSLKEIMQTGFVGCVHFPKQENPNCDVRVLMLVSINELYTYVGFIPNDQPAFVTAMRNVATKNLKTIRRGKQGGMVGMQTGPDNQQNEVSLLQQQPLLPGNNASNTNNPQLHQLLELSRQVLSQGFGQRAGAAEMGQGPGNGQPPPTNPDDGVPDPQ